MQCAPGCRSSPSPRRCHAPPTPPPGPPPRQRPCVQPPDWPGPWPSANRRGRDLSCRRERRAGCRHRPCAACRGSTGAGKRCGRAGGREPGLRPNECAPPLDHLVQREVCAVVGRLLALQPAGRNARASVAREKQTHSAGGQPARKSPNLELLRLSNGVSAALARLGAGGALFGGVGALQNSILRSQPGMARNARAARRGSLRKQGRVHILHHVSQARLVERDALLNLALILG